MKSYYEWPIGTHQRSFERYHSGPPTSHPFLDSKFTTVAQNSNRYYPRNG